MLIKSYDDRQLRSKETQNIILKFLRDEIWSDARNLSKLINVGNTAIYKILSRLEKKELLKTHYIPELKFKVWGITSMGMIYSWADDEAMADRYVFEPAKLKTMMVYHHLDLQLARFKAENKGWKNWVPGNLLPRGIPKRPDAVVDIVVTNQKVAVELERTIKTKKRYEIIFSIYLQAIKRGEYFEIHYVCPDSGFAVRLRRIFKLIKSVPVAGERVQISEKHRSKFPVYALDQWPPENLKKGMD